MALSKHQIVMWSIPAVLVLAGIGLTTIRANISNEADGSQDNRSALLLTAAPVAMQAKHATVAEESTRKLQQRLQVTTQPPKARAAPTGKVAIAQASAQSAEQLSIEGDFVDDTNLKVADIDQMLSEKNFDDTFKRFEEQMFRDPLATELGTAYNEEISKKLLEDQTGSRLTKLACGLKVCVGRVQSPVGAEFSKWTESFQNNPETPYSSVVFMPSKESPAGTTTRFLFSTDPNVNGGILPQGTPMPASVAGTILPPPPTPPSGG